MKVERLESIKKIDERCISQGDVKIENEVIDMCMLENI